MNQEEKFLECLTKATKGKKDLTNFEVLEFAFSIFCCLDNYIQNCRRKNKISIWKNKTSIKVEILFFYKA
ncbi:hypothetical protein GC786_08910 [Campylobacter coli]|nr:hypothetical protein [Campylobacter coli]